VTQYITEFEGKKLKSVGKGIFQPAAEEQFEGEAGNYKGLLERIARAASQRARKGGAVSTRLTSSPACLVWTSTTTARQFERVTPREGRTCRSSGGSGAKPGASHREAQCWKRYKASDFGPGVSVGRVAVLAGGAGRRVGSCPDPVRFQKLTAS